MTNTPLRKSNRVFIMENFGSDQYLNMAMAAKLSTYTPSEEELLELANRLTGVCDLTVDDNDVIAKHVDQLSRSPVQRPRKIRWPKKRLHVPRHFRNGLNQIQADIEQGLDLTKWLSKKINHDYTDELLNNWDIHHFHFLPNTVNPRGAHRLYCFIDRDEVYFLTVSDQAEWENAELIEIAHRNFRKRMKRFVITGVNVPSVDKVNVSNLRNKNTNFLLKVADGTVYCPPSMGINTDGSKTISTYLADLINHNLAEGRFKLNTKSNSNQ